MNYIDLGLLIVMVLSVLIGYKSGVIKSIVRLLAFLLSAILAYQFKGILAGFLIDFMPFYQFSGVFEGITSVSILLYHGLSFLFIFILIYSILSIVITLAGFLDKILKMTIILYLPDKILGAVVGFIQGVMISFVAIFVLVQIPYTQEIVMNSTYGYQILNRTPIIRTVLADTTVISGEIFDIITNEENETDEDAQSIQSQIMLVFVKYGLITADEAQELVDSETVYLPGVIFQ